MKILICSDGRHAHYFQRLSWANAFDNCGHDVFFWDNKTTTAFDAFDLSQPDIFLGQSYNLDDATIKCIKERPHLRVGLRVGDWGDHEQEVDKSMYNILFCSQKEKETLKKLKDETGKPDFVHIHYPDWAVEQTHNHFESIGVKAASLMMCGDVNVYSGGKRREELMCDIGFVGGYWPYKGIVIDQYLMPLLHPVGEYNVKIFGNQPWPASQYCGLIQDHLVKDLFTSAKICPNLSEPHAHRFGFDVNERIFKVLLAGGFCVTDNVKGYEMFGDGVVVADSPQDFAEKIHYYAKTDQGTIDRAEIIHTGQTFVKQNHTNYHRAAQIMSLLGYESEAKKILKVVDEF
jgi:hypothetical protein